MGESPNPRGPASRTSLSLGSRAIHTLGGGGGSHNTAPCTKPCPPSILQNGCWVLHLNLEQRFHFRLQPALPRNIPLSHTAPTLARVYCYFIYWCLPEVFVGFLCVYSLNPSLVPRKRDFMLLSLHILGQEQNLAHSGQFCVFMEDEGERGNF